MGGEHREGQNIGGQNMRGQQVEGQQVEGHIKKSDQVEGQKMGEMILEESDYEPRENTEDPKKQTEAELFDQVMAELPKKQTETDLVGQVAEFPNELDEDLNKSLGTTNSLSTIKKQTDKQNYPSFRMVEETVFWKKNKFKRSSIDDCLLQQPPTTTILVPEEELEEAVQNICDL